MSFGQRPLTLSDATSFVSMEDPGIDWERIEREEVELLDPDKRRTATEAQKEAMAAFQVKIADAMVHSPADTLHLYRAKDGHQLTEFSLGVIPPGELTRIHDECKVNTVDELTEQAHWRCFLMGLRGIKNWGGTAPETVRRGDVEYVSPAWIERTFVRGLRSIAIEVGRAIWFYNQLSDEEAKN